MPVNRFQPPSSKVSFPSSLPWVPRRIRSSRWRSQIPIKTKGIRPTWPISWGTAVTPTSNRSWPFTSLFQDMTSRRKSCWPNGEKIKAANGQQLGPREWQPVRWKKSRLALALEPSFKLLRCLRFLLTPKSSVPSRSSSWKKASVMMNGMRPFLRRMPTRKLVSRDGTSARWLRLGAPWAPTKVGRRTLLWKLRVPAVAARSSWPVCLEPLAKALWSLANRETLTSKSSATRWPPWLLWKASCFCCDWFLFPFAFLLSLVRWLGEGDQQSPGHCCQTFCANWWPACPEEGQRFGSVVHRPDLGDWQVESLPVSSKWSPARWLQTWAPSSCQGLGGFYTGEPDQSKGQSEEQPGSCVDWFTQYSQFCRLLQPDFGSSVDRSAEKKVLPAACLGLRRFSDLLGRSKEMNISLKQ